MLKSLSLALVVMTSASAFAQSQSLEDLAQEVKQLTASAERLDANDQTLVRKNLRQIIAVFKIAGVETGSSISVICDSNSNQLINTDTGRMLHDFTSTEHCREALANVKVGKSFCDYNDNTLYSPNGSLVHDFSESTNCRDAIASISRVKKYCDYNDNTLRKADGSLIYDFSSREECTRNL
jgi:hypothetical protein